MKYIDEIFKTIYEIFQSLIIIAIVMLALFAMSAIVYTIWENAIGWAFHLDRNTCPIVAAIVLCGLQLNLFKAKK
jgi:hypothetical protein